MGVNGKSYAGQGALLQCQVKGKVVSTAMTYRYLLPLIAPAQFFLCANS